MSHVSDCPLCDGEGCPDCDLGCSHCGEDSHPYGCPSDPPEPCKTCGALSRWAQVDGRAFDWFDGCCCNALAPISPVPCDRPMTHRMLDDHDMPPQEREVYRAILILGDRRVIRVAVAGEQETVGWMDDRGPVVSLNEVVRRSDGREHITRTSVATLTGIQLSALYQTHSLHIGDSRILLVDDYPARPEFYACGCSRMKVDADRCDVFLPGGEPRTPFPPQGSGC